MPAATLTSKGQVTIPKEIRDRLQLRRGQRVDFRLSASGDVIMIPLLNDIRRLKGIVRSPGGRPASLDEIERAIRKGYSGQ